SSSSNCRSVVQLLVSVPNSGKQPAVKIPYINTIEACQPAVSYCWSVVLVSIQSFTSRIHSFSHFLLPSFTPSLLHSFTPSLLHSFTPSLLHSFTPSL